MDFKFGLTVGAVSLDFEGTEDAFIKNIAKFAEKMLDGSAVKLLPSTGPGENLGKMPDEVHSSTTQMTAKAVATKLQCQSGGSLLYAAVAKLAVIDGKDTFNRQEIISTMKSATGFYKPSYLSNLSNYLDVIQKKGILIEVTKDSFSVKHSDKQKMRIEIL